MALKILHTSDWHYGLSSWNDGKRRERNGELEYCLEYMLEKAKEEKVDLIIHAGDILDAITPPSAETAKYISHIFMEMGKIAPTVVILGNHDWKGLAAWSRMAAGAKVYICDSYREIELEKCKIFAVPYIDKRKLHKDYEMGDTKTGEKELLDVIKGNIESGLSDTKYNIAVMHGSVEGLFYVGEEIFGSDLIIPESFFDARIDYTALGHIHNFQKIDKGGKVYYSGAPIKCTFGEEKSMAGFAIADIDDKGSVVSFVETPHKKLKTIEKEYAGEGLELLKGKIGNEIIEEGYYRIILRGEEFPNYTYNDILESDERIVSVKIISEKKASEEGIDTEEKIENIEIEFGKYLRFEEQYDDEVYSLFLRYIGEVEDDV